MHLPLLRLIHPQTHCPNTNRKMRCFVILVLLAGLLLPAMTATAQDSTSGDSGLVNRLLEQFEENTYQPPTVDDQADNVTENATTADTITTPITGMPDVGDNAKLPALPNFPPSYEDRPSVILRALDKVTAKTETFAIPVGQQFDFGALTIAVRACRARPPLEPADAAAFLQIVEQKAGEMMIPRYSGWMFSSSPSLAALEHPVYDVWVVGCGEQKAENKN